MKKTKYILLTIALLFIGCATDQDNSISNKLTSNKTTSTFISASNTYNSTNKTTSNNKVDSTTSIPFTSIAFSTPDLRLNVGESYQFGVSALPRNATEGLTLQTENSDLIELNGYGKITAKKIGTGKVFVETYNGLRAEAIVHIFDFEKNEDVTLNNWSNPAYFVYETAKVSKIKFSFLPTGSPTIQPVSYSMELYKTEALESAYNGPFKVHWQLYSPDGVVFDSGTLKTASFSVNEKTILSGTLYVKLNDSFSAGMYKMVLSDVAW